MWNKSHFAHQNFYYGLLGLCGWVRRREAVGYLETKYSEGTNRFLLHPGFNSAMPFLNIKTGTIIPEFQKLLRFVSPIMKQVLKPAEPFTWVTLGFGSLGAATAGLTRAKVFHRNSGHTRAPPNGRNACAGTRLKWIMYKISFLDKIWLRQTGAHQLMPASMCQSG